MNENESAQLLTLHGIKPTANRIVVAKALAAEGRPLSLGELERRIATIDKSGIFRSLTLFREHHLVHVIEDGGEGVRYELCRSHSATGDDDMHVHFFCERCHQTFCLGDIQIPSVSLPNGYEMTTANYVVKGICPKCAKKP
jgi:Fur family transcriptional regulator, ferric uptake regulator